MNLTTKFTTIARKTITVSIMLVLTFMVLTMMQDMLRSTLKNSAFYFSESLLFSSFWWLFAPLGLSQYFVVKRYKIPFILQFLNIIFPIVLHLLAFPCLVWLLSATFYYHTFSLQQTFNFALSEYLYILILLYTIPIIAYQYFTKKTMIVVPDSISKNPFISTIIVTEGNRKYPINVSKIFYFSANSPYINIHLENKKYLHNETLKSITTQLNPEQFVRIHKSTIINIKMVASYATRFNGDYDLTMKNNSQIRVSRNFANDFKILFNKTPHFTTK